MDPSLLPASPYRGLKSFRFPDQNIFSGREIETDKIYRLLLQFRGMMIFGPSGTGKSSLVGAGLIPLLLGKSFQPEVIRLNPDENGAFVVTRILKNEETNEYFDSYFNEFIDPANPQNDKINISFDDFKNKISKLEPTLSNQPVLVKGRRQERNRISVLIFDQFEELITHFEETQLTDNLKIHSLTLQERVALQGKIISLLTECYYKENLYVKLIMVFREDYLAKFGKLFNSVPDLKDHYLRIKPLNVEKLPEIISCPFNTEEKRRHFKDPFSEELIGLLSAKINDHCQDGNLILTEVQIVCLQIYNLHSEQEREKMLRDETVSKILENFYLELLNRLSSSEKPVAIDILSLLVLNEKTRNIYHEDAIIEELEKTYKVVDIKRVIKKLEDDINVIRREIRQGGTYYEIVSEAIIPEINKRRIEKGKEKIITAQKKKQQFRGIIVLAVITIFIAGYFYFQADKLRRVERIKFAENSWYQKLPDDSMRNEAVRTLDKYDPNSTDYKKYKTLFAILAQSYYYASVNNYNDALAIAYYAYKGFNVEANDPMKSKFSKRINDFMMPVQTLNDGQSSVTAAFAGLGGKYFLLSSDGLITVRDAFDTEYRRPIQLFMRSNPGLKISETQAPELNERTRLQESPSVKILQTTSKNYFYLLYNKNNCYVFDSSLVQVAVINPKGNDVVAVFPFSPGYFLLLNGDGSYNIYKCDKGVISLATTSRLPTPENEEQSDISSVKIFDNKKYFEVTLSNGQVRQCEIQINGNVITKPVAYNEDIMNINQGQMQLVSIRNKNFRIRNERYLSSFIPGCISATLLADTNLLVSYRYNKATIYQVVVADSGLLLEGGQVIDQLPENRTPVIYSRGGHVVIKSNRSFILYDINTRKQRYLFSAARTNNDNGFEKVARSVDLFINDSIFAVISEQTLNLYNVGMDNEDLVVNAGQDGSLRSTAFNLLKNNDEMDQQELFNLFPQELGRGLLDAFFQMGNYDSSVALAKKLLPLTKPEKKIELYQKLYDSYENLRNALPSTSRNIATQLHYTRQMVYYADSMFLSGKDTAVFYNNFVKAMGSLSWYLILNRDYKSALDTASIAIALDKNEQQQWIHTNQALGYLFNDSIPQAMNVYKTWSDKYFNDDFKKAAVRFREDIDNLKSNYDVDIPRKDEVLKMLQ